MVSSLLPSSLQLLNVVVLLLALNRAIPLVDTYNIYKLASFIWHGYCETFKCPQFLSLLSPGVQTQRGWSNFLLCRLHRCFVSLEEWKIDLGHQNARSLMTWKLLWINQTVCQNEVLWHSNAYASLLCQPNVKNRDSYFKRQWRVISEFNVSRDRLLEVFMPNLTFFVTT